MLSRCAVVLAVVLLARADPRAASNGGARWVSQALAEAMMDYAPTSDTNPECTLHSSLYLRGLANSTLWAVQMLDSSSLTVGGLLTGDMYALGHYDQCLDVYVPETRLRGQHCLATLRYGPTPDLYPQYYTPPNITFHEPPIDAPVWEKVKATLDPGVTRRDLFRWAVCVPASCSAQDIQHSLNLTLTPVFTRHGLQATVTVDPQFCHKVEDQEIPPTVGYITTRVVIMLLVLVSVLATVYDYVLPYFRDQKFESTLAELAEKVLLAFSMRRNADELTEKGANPRLDIINGGKVISIAAILFGHRALYSHGLALSNQQFWELRLENHFLDNAIMNATHLVDLFFVCSGALAYLGVHKALEKRKSINFAQAIFLRWLRIVPSYLLMMGIVGWLLPHMSDGPLWDKRVGLEARRCQDNWWLNLLFINNYIHADNQCLLLSWYLACDMQFFVIGIFAMYVLWRWRRLGFILFAALLAASIAIPFYVIYQGEYSGVLKLYASSVLVDPFSNEYFNSVYVKSHNRFGPYIVGVLVGYLMATLAAANYKFSKRTIILGFLLLFGGGYAHQTYGFLFYQKDRPYSLLENAIYAGFHRITFSIGIGWIALTFYTTGFGPFKTLLAQPIFTPLCRLVYCTVLIHPVVQLAEASSVRHSEYMNYPKMFWMACGDYLVSNLLALPLYLMVEAPCRTVVKILLLDRHPASVKKISPSPAPEGAQPPDQPRQVVVSKL